MLVDCRTAALRQLCQMGVAKIITKEFQKSAVVRIVQEITWHLELRVTH